MRDHDTHSPTHSHSHRQPQTATDTHRRAPPTLGSFVSNSDRCVGKAFFWRDGGRDGWLDADDPEGSNNRAIRSRRVGDGGPSPPPLGTARLKWADAMRGMGARWRSF